jgi:hypothetical protein
MADVTGGDLMKKILRHDRVRRINGGFSYIPQRFMTSGFLESLSQKELLLYLFLVIVSDRNGLSYYSYDKICTTLEMDVEDYIEARNSLIGKDLLAFDGTVFQVLELPEKAPDVPARKADAYDAL